MARLTLTEKDLLTRMLTSHAYRERLAAERFREALSLLPLHESETYWLGVIDEEQEHYVGCLDVAKQIRIDLEPLVASRMTRQPPGIPCFETWLDVLLAHAFNDKAGYYVLLGLMRSKVTPYAKLASHIVAEEESHGAMGVKALVTYYPASNESDHVKQETLIRHLDAAVRCLGRPNSWRDKEAVSAGLKTRPASVTITDFCAYADEVLERLDCQNLIPISGRYMK
jgi:1,2-phenylacetyl-CoA epoxidase catalytic subunit